MNALPRDTALPLLIGEPNEFFRQYRRPILLLLVGATFDALTTLINLRKFGSGIEAHIVQRWVDDLIGVSAGVPLAKLIQLGFVLFVAAWWRPWCTIILIVCGVLYSTAAVSNHYLLI